MTKSSPATSSLKRQLTATSSVLTAPEKNAKRKWTSNSSKASLTNPVTMDPVHSRFTYSESLCFIQESLTQLASLKKYTKEIQYYLRLTEQCSTSLQETWKCLKSTELSGLIEKTTSRKHLKGCLKSVEWCDCSRKRQMKQDLRNGRYTPGLK